MHASCVSTADDGDDDDDRRNTAASESCSSVPESAKFKFELSNERAEAVSLLFTY